MGNKKSNLELKNEEFIRSLKNDSSKLRNLKEAGEKFRIFNEQSLLSIAILQDNLFKYFNDKFLKVIGYTREEVESWKPGEFLKIIHPRDREFVKKQAKLKQEGKSGYVKNYEFKGLTKNGEIYWCEIFTKSIEYKGRPADFVMTRDISERKKYEKKLENSEKRYRTLVNNLNDILIEIDLGGKINYVNPQFYKKLGFGEENAIGSSIKDFLHPDDRFFKKENLVECLKESKPLVGNFRLQSLSGTFRSFAMRGNVIKDQGRIRIVGIFREKTNKKYARRKLKESEEKFRSIAEQSLIGMAILQDNQIKYVNKKFGEIVGYNIRELKNWEPYEYLKFIHPEFRELVKEEVEKKQRGEKDVLHNHQLKIIKKSGEERWVEVYAKAIKTLGRYADLVFWLDITEQIEAQEKLLESQKMYKSLFDNNPIGSGVATPEGQPLALNKRMREILGYSLNELEELGIQNLYVNPEKRKIFFKLLEKNGNISNFEIKLQRKDGKIITTSISSDFVKINKKKLLVTNIQNITHLKVAERELRISEKRYRHLFEESPFYIILIDKQWKVIDCNNTVEEILGYKKNEIIGKKLEKIGLVEKSLIPKLEKRTEKLFQTEKLNPIEMQIKDADGKPIWVLSQPSFIKIEGTPYIQLLGRDITAQKESKKLLRESEKSYSRLARNLPGLVYRINWNENKEMIFFNDLLEDMTGYTYQELDPGELCSLDHYIQEVDRTRIIKKIQYSLHSNEPFNIEYRFKRKDGQIRWFSERGRGIKNEEGNLLYIDGVIFDITDRKKIESELRELTRMKSEILRRTSHELKTPLVSIKGFSDLLLNMYKQDLSEGVEKLIKEIKKGCVRLEDLVSDILSAAKLESGEYKLEKEKVNIKKILENSIQGLKGMIKLRKHTIDLNLEKDITIYGEKKLITEVIDNLLINAVKYTPPSGNINVTVEEKKQEIIIKIKDTGIGLTEEEKKRIFKRFGKIERYGQNLDVIPGGTGLGLYISKKIIELHNGKIWAKSAGKNKGSTFLFTLPLKPEE